MKLTQRTVKSLVNGPSRVDVRDSDLTGFLLRLGALPSQSRTYFVYYRSPETGKRVNYRLGTTEQLSVTQARDAAERAMGQVALGICPHSARLRTRAESRALLIEEQTERRRTMRAFIDGSYGGQSAKKHKRPDEHLARLRANFGHWFDEPLSSLMAERVQGWVQEREAKGIKPSTIIRDVNDLKSILTQATKARLIDENPLEGFRAAVLPGERGRVRYLSDEEEARLRTALIAHTGKLQTERESANAWRRNRQHAELPAEVADYLPPMVLLMLNTGLRRGEVFTLRWDAIDLPNRTLTVRGEFSKNSRYRDVPLNDEAMAVLTRWQMQTDSDGWVFVSPKTGMPFTHIRRAWSALIDASSITNFHIHDLRHTFASRLVSAGIPLFDVGELLGHRDTATTRIYAHLAPDRKAAAVAILNKPKLAAIR